MKIISQKLHAYISLATPHLGTLFSDSQIVSTGKAIMRAFTKTIFCDDDISGFCFDSLHFFIKRC